MTDRLVQDQFGRPQRLYSFALPAVLLMNSISGSVWPPPTRSVWPPSSTKSPNLNAYAERWVRSVKSECISNLIFFGEASLRKALSEFTTHYHKERNHQGKDNRLLCKAANDEASSTNTSSIDCTERLGGLLKFYFRKAA